MKIQHIIFVCLFNFSVLIGMHHETPGSAGWMFVSLFTSKDIAQMPAAFIIYDFTEDNMTEIVNDLRTHIKDKEERAVVINYPAWFPRVTEKVVKIKDSFKEYKHMSIHLIPTKKPVINS